jgi:hypothetical protein
MALVRHALDHIRHALHGGETSLDAISIVNTAGEHLFALRPWRFAVKADGKLDFVAAQPFAALPVDFMELVAYDRANSLVRGLRLASLQDILDARSNTSLTQNFAFIGAIAGAVPRLELWPTPSVDIPAALTIAYRFGWTRLYDDGDDLADAGLPPWLEASFFQFCRALAQGWEEDDIATATLRLTEVERFPPLLAAIRRDIVAQPSLGTLASYSDTLANDYPWQPDPVGGPS